MLDFVLYSILPFLFILGFCITIHELGHFIVAKLSKIPVEKFSIGFGPPLLRKKIGETDFRIAYFPLGGYVKMAGEDEGEIIKQEEEKKKPDVPGFYDAPIYKRVGVVSCGPLFNILSAFLVLFVIFAVYGVVVNPFMKITVEEPSYYHNLGFSTHDSVVAVNGQHVENWERFWEIIEDDKDKEANVTVMRHGSTYEIHARMYEDSLGITPFVPPLVGAIQQNSPADKAGIKQGDRIVSIDGHGVNSWTEMVDLVRTAQNTPLEFTWLHQEEQMTATIMPKAFYDPIEQDTIGQIGVFMPHGRTRLSFTRALTLSIQRTGEMIYRVLEIFYQLITRQIPARQLGGPIAIFKLSTESAQWGFEYLLGLLVIISVNLGLINLFPLPALDGGHIVIGIIEALRKKRFSRRTRLVIQQIGYALIFLLIIFVTFNDITR